MCFTLNAANDRGIADHTLFVFAPSRKIDKCRRRSDETELTDDFHDSTNVLLLPGSSRKPHSFLKCGVQPHISNLADDVIQSHHKSCPPVTGSEDSKASGGGGGGS